MISHSICPAYQQRLKTANCDTTCMKCLLYQSVNQVKVVGIKFKTRKTIVYDNLGLLVKDIVFQCYQIPHC